MDQTGAPEGTFFIPFKHDVAEAVRQFWPDGVFGVKDEYAILDRYLDTPRWVARGVGKDGKFYLLTSAEARKGIAQVVPELVYEYKPELPTIEIDF